MQPLDWVSVTLEDLVSCGLRRSITKLQLGIVLEQRYPHLDWTNLHRWKGRFAQQRELERIVKTLFQVFFPHLK
jgi:hypothetical protein